MKYGPYSKNTKNRLNSPIFRFIDTIFNFTSITSGFTNLFNDSSLLTYAGVAILAIVLFGNINLISSSNLTQYESYAGILHTSR